MLRGNEFFYDQEVYQPEFISQTSAQQLIRDPKLYTMTGTVVVQKPAAPAADKNKPVIMRVSICCSSCVDIIEHDLHKLTGMKKVDCDIYRNKVTVTGTAPLADVLSAARRHFKDAELWD